MRRFSRILQRAFQRPASAIPTGLRSSRPASFTSQPFPERRLTDQTSRAVPGFSRFPNPASDFLSFDFSTGTFGTANPNFAGGPLTLGLSQITQIGIDQTGNLITQFQDLSFDIHTAVPEPGSLALLGIALAGFVTIRRRRAM